jgi:hypothetical protein
LKLCNGDDEGCEMIFKALALLALCALCTAGQRNFTIQHFVPGSKCQGTPFLTQSWSRPGPNTFACSTDNIESGTTPSNTPQAYAAYCERQTLALSDSVNVLQLKFYYNGPSCGFGSPDDEVPKAVTVRVSGSVCFTEGQLFPSTAVKVFHDCQGSAANNLGPGLIMAIFLTVSLSLIL